jgi:hypothetical protein
MQHDPGGIRVTISKQHLADLPPPDREIRVKTYRHLEDIVALDHGRTGRMPVLHSFSVLPRDFERTGICGSVSEQLEGIAELHSARFDVEAEAGTLDSSRQGRQRTSQVRERTFDSM